MSCQGEGPYGETSGEKCAEPFFASKLSVSAKLETWGVGKLLLAMPIVLESLDEQVAADRAGHATHHVLPSIVAVLQVGCESNGRARCETNPWL
jgi:hypothetical protein